MVTEPATYSFSPALDKRLARKGCMVVITHDERIARVVHYDGYFNVVGYWSVETFIHPPSPDFVLDGIGYSFEDPQLYGCFDESTENSRWQSLYEELHQSDSLLELEVLNDFMGYRVRQNASSSLLECCVDAGLVIQQVNTPFCDCIGKKEIELLRTSFVKLLPAFEHETFQRHINSIHKGTCRVVELAVQGSDGPHWIEWSHSEYKSNAGIRYEGIGRVIHRAADKIAAEEAALITAQA